MRFGKAEYVYFALMLTLLIWPGCRREEVSKAPTPAVAQISVDALTRGESTTLFGENFGKRRGSVQIGETPARVINWTDNMIRMRIPNVPDGIHNVTIKLSTGESFLRGKIAVRGAVEDGMYDWVDSARQSIDGAGLEPLVIMFCPVGSNNGPRFDYNAPIPKNRTELINEVEWAYMQGVQMARVFFPAEMTADAKAYADLSMDNIRGIISEISKQCPGMMLEAIDTDLPAADRLRVRNNPALSFTSPISFGDVRAKLPSGETVSGINSAENINTTLIRSDGFLLKPLPVVMTQWQAFSITNLIKNGAALKKPFVFQIHMSYDDRAEDSAGSYDLIRGRLPEGSRFMTVVTRKNVAQIIGRAVTRGDHIVFGFQYSTYWPGDSKNYITGNMFVLEKIIEAAERIGRPIATIEQAEQMVGKFTRRPVSEAKMTIRNIVPDRRGKDTLPTSALASVALKADGSDLWFGSATGTFYSADKGEKFRSVKLPVENATAVNAVAATDNGAVWVGTNGHGLLKTADMGANFNRYTVESGILDGDVIGCLYAAENTVYACMYGAEEGNPGKGIVYTPDGGGEWYVITEAEGLPSNEVSTIFFEDEWIFAGLGKLTDDGSVGGMIFSDDYGVGWSRVQGIDAKVTAIIPWHDNTLMVGTRAGLFTVGYGDTKARRVKAVPDDTKITFMTMDNRGWLWIGTGGGLLVTDDKGQTVRAVTAADGLGSNVVRGGVCVPPYDMYFATEPGGAGAQGGLTKIHIPR